LVRWAGPTRHLATGVITHNLRLLTRGVWSPLGG
jgi:hypothetical protein